MLRTAPNVLFFWTVVPVVACLAAAYVVLVCYRVFRPVNPDNFPVVRRLRGAVFGHRGGVGTNDPTADKAFLLSSGIAAAADAYSLDLYDTRIPRNTLSAFRAARSRGLAGVELDVQLTSDGVPVVFHDEIVGRTLAVPSEDANRRVDSYTASELCALPFSPLFCGPLFLPQERVPTLAAALAQLRADGLLAFVELKTPRLGDGAAARALATAAVRVLTETRMHTRAVLISFNPYALYCVRRLPEARAMATGLVFAHDVIANIERGTCLSHHRCVSFLVASILTLSPSLSLVPPNSERARVGLPVPLPLQLGPVSLLLSLLNRFLSHPRVLPLLGHSVAVAEAPAVSSALAAAYAQRGAALAAWTVNDAHTQRWVLESLTGAVISDVPIPLPVPITVAVPGGVDEDAPSIAPPQPPPQQQQEQQGQRAVVAAAAAQAQASVHVQPSMPVSTADPTVGAAQQQQQQQQASAGLVAALKAVAATLDAPVPRVSSVPGLAAAVTRLPYTLSTDAAAASAAASETEAASASDDSDIESSAHAHVPLQQQQQQHQQLTSAAPAAPAATDEGGLRMRAVV
jgi:glycerophosphoryl diester phosphodiesterase